MAGTPNGAARRERRPDGSFARGPGEPRSTANTAAPRSTSLVGRDDFSQQRLTPDKLRNLRFIPKSDTAPGQPTALAPNFGRQPVPHATSFSSILSSYSHVYRPSDEAMRNSKDNARFMRTHCDVMESLEARKRATALLNWHIEAEDSKDPLQKIACDNITRVIKKIPYFKKYRDCLLEALWYGRYAVQQRWQWTFIDGQKRAYPGRWQPVNGDKLKFRFDDGSDEFDPDEIGIRVNRAAVKNGHSDQIEITDEGPAYFLRNWERPCLAVHKHILEDGAFEDPLSAGSIHGVGIRSRIYWTWFQGAETLAMLMEYMEKYGMGFAVGYYPANDAAAKASMDTTLRNMRADNYVLIPRVNGDPSLDAYGIEIVQPTPAGAETLKAIITELFGDRIKRYILGQTLTSEANGAGLGSSGISDLHKWSFYQIIKSDAIDLEETLTTELVKWIVRFNPGIVPAEVAGCDFRFKIDTDSPDVQGQLEAFTAAYQLGLRIKAADVYDTCGISEPEDTDEVLSQSSAMAAMGGGLGASGFGAMESAGISGEIAGQKVGENGNEKVNAGNLDSETKPGNQPGGRGMYDILRETINTHRTGAKPTKDKNQRRGVRQMALFAP